VSELRARGEIAVDACCLINLLASQAVLPTPSALGRRKAARRTLSALDATLYVPAMIANEALYVLRPDDGDPSNLVKEPIDLASYFAHGILRECDVLGDEETDLFVRFATRLDDGEAACLAIAHHRGWSLATDDRPATALARQAGVLIVTTAELVKQWAKNARAKKHEITTVLLTIQRYAKFVPRPNSPDAEWWFSHASS
jgi:hypothetical protein